MAYRLELQSLSATELIETLAVRIYEPPLSRVRECLSKVAWPLRILILVLDFDTEVSMQGMLGFLENSTGLYFRETVEAFEAIGATRTAGILHDVTKTLEEHGVAPSRLRDDFAGTAEFQITTFNKLHGDLGSLPADVERDAKRLYIYGESGTREPVWQLLEAFVGTYRDAIIAEVNRLGGR